MSNVVMLTSPRLHQPMILAKKQARAFEANMAQRAARDRLVRMYRDAFLATLPRFKLIEHHS